MSVERIQPLAAEARGYASGLYGHNSPLKRLLTELADGLDAKAAEVRRLCEALEEMAKWPGNYGGNASARARHALEGD